MLSVGISGTTYARVFAADLVQVQQAVKEEPAANQKLHPASRAGGMQEESVA
jgi:hypothetical protein